MEDDPIPPTEEVGISVDSLQGAREDPDRRQAVGHGLRVVRDDLEDALENGEPWKEIAIPEPEQVPTGDARIECRDCGDFRVYYLRRSSFLMKDAESGKQVLDVGSLLDAVR